MPSEATFALRPSAGLSRGAFIRSINLHASVEGSEPWLAERRAGVLPSSERQGTLRACHWKGIAESTGCCHRFPEGAGSPPRYVTHTCDWAKTEPTDPFHLWTIYFLLWHIPEHFKCTVMYFKLLCHYKVGLLRSMPTDFLLKTTLAGEAEGRDINAN